MSQKIIPLIVVIFISGCVSQHYVPDVEAELRSSPKVEMLTEEKPAPRTDAENIESYYFWWNPLTRPDAVQNWEEIFVMGESSSPDWNYIKIANLEIAQRTRNDMTAMQSLRSLASSMGGDALIDLRRDPMIDSPKFGAKIIGFRYLATVVRKKE